MSHCRVSVPIADLRAAPDPASELLTQAVLATAAEAGEDQGAWTLVDLPDYRGWLRTAELVVAGGVGGERSLLVIAPRIDGVLDGSQSRLVIYAGTVLAERDRAEDSVLAELPDRRTVRLPLDATARLGDPPGATMKVERVLAFAHVYLGAPYLWGGWTVEGIDCSGLVQLAYRMVGHTLPRDAHQQHAALAGGVPAGDLRPSDLVFFHEDNRISHVGIYVGNGSYLHASMIAGRVLISRLFDPANELDRAYAAKYAGARRVIHDD